VTQDRLREVSEVMTSAAEWAKREPEICGIAVVGSWARMTAGMESDIDLVVLTGDAERYLEHDDWFGTFAAVDVVRREQWGPYLSEVRLRRASGLEIEVGITRLTWANTDPVDPGTRRVVTDGMRIVHDPDRVFATLQAACA